MQDFQFHIDMFAFLARFSFCNCFFCAQTEKSLMAPLLLFSQLYTIQLLLHTLDVHMHSAFSLIHSIFVQTECYVSETRYVLHSKQQHIEWNKKLFIFLSIESIVDFREKKIALKWKHSANSMLKAKAMLNERKSFMKLHWMWETLHRATVESAIPIN